MRVLLFLFLTLGALSGCSLRAVVEPPDYQAALAGDREPERKRPKLRFTNDFFEDSNIKFSCDTRGFVVRKTFLLGTGKPHYAPPRQDNVYSLRSY